MKPEENTHIVVHEWSYWRIGVLVALVAGVITSVVGVMTFQSLSSRAAVEKVAPTPLAIASQPPPATHLHPPYVRLYAQKQEVGFNQSIPVDVYLQTDGQNTQEVNISLSYDADLLRVGEDDVKSTDVYKSINVQNVEDGSIVFSLFVNPQVGHEGVSLEKETKIATITFHTRTEAQAEVVITPEYAKDSIDDTSLVAYSKERPEEIENILESVEGTTFAIVP